MAKKKAAAKKVERSKRTTKKPTGKSRQRTSTIKPPAAPPLVHSAEVGAPVAQDQAIIERLRLYPRATVQEIVAMFELDGLKITPAAVRKAKERMG